MNSCSNSCCVWACADKPIANNTANRVAEKSFLMFLFGKEGFPSSSAIVVIELELEKLVITGNKIDVRNPRVRRIWVTFLVKAALGAVRLRTCEK